MTNHKRFRPNIIVHFMSIPITHGVSNTETDTTTIPNRTSKTRYTETFITISTQTIRITIESYIKINKIRIKFIIIHKQIDMEN